MIGCGRHRLCSSVVRSRYYYSSKSDPSSSSSALPKPHLNYRSIVENVVSKSQNALDRKAPIPPGTIQTIERIYSQHKAISSSLNARREARAAIGKRVRSSGEDPLARQAALAEAMKVKEEIGLLEKQVASAEEQLFDLGSLVPNDTHPESPTGDARTLSTHGPPPVPASESRDHVSVGRALKLLDFEAGSTVTGSSWYYLLNEGALLEMALVNYSLSIATKHGFSPVVTPDVVRADIASRCGFQPRDQNAHPPVSQMYHIASSNPEKTHPELVLSGTAEIPLAGMFANKIYPCAELPLKVVGLGRAFRAEAGARGADTRGLYRVHQFTKLELFVVASQEESEAVMEEMKAIQIEIFEGLGLSFRVLDMPKEDLGASAYRKYDMEAWMPGRGSWGEISSASNCTDYQSRRLHIRYRETSAAAAATSPTGVQSRHIRFAHTLNGTAAAVPRLIVALLENGARFDENGVAVGLDLPTALKPFWIGNCSESGLIRWV